MAYEVEAIAPDFPTAVASTVFRPERTVDHSEFNPPRKQATAEIKTETPESKPPTAAQETAPAVTLAPAAAALARREQRVQQQRAEIKAQQEALEAERQEIAELKAIKAKLSAKDFSGVESLVPYDAYTNYLIEKGSGSSPEQEALKQIDSRVKAMEDSYKSETEKRFEVAVEQRREAVKTIVENNPEFSSIKEMGAAEHVVRHILDTFEEEGVELSPEQAAKDVEDAILARAQKWATVSKLKPKEVPKEETKKTLPPLKPAVSTITNAMAATGDVKVAKRNYANMRSDSERWAAARSAVTASGETLKG